MNQTGKELWERALDDHFKERDREALDSLVDTLLLGVVVVTSPVWLPVFLVGCLVAWVVRRWLS